MGDGYNVEPASLDKHEQDIRQVMEQVSGAVNSVRDLFDVEAFGIVGTVWATALNAWVQQHTSCIDSAVKAGNQVADSVGKMAQNYRQNEQNVAQSFTSISNDMEA
ncbi:MAG TPA: type VII secretion target [Pseudonocardiaceae bacterium]|jgi:ABC-type transporter Mla subunit MlaD|nr:type VII secretion target [Pseudonocardiaceae bacterium]